MYYTKYRPQNFSEIEKTTSSVESLVTQVKSEKVAHAYLFVGPKGTGKTTTARILAKALNCKKLKDNGDPCGKCAPCLSIQAGTFVDLIEIDAASNRGIDDIRDLREKVRLTPSMGQCKVYIVDEVHMLSNDAFNAFLKTLEEPPKHVTFILCTTEAHKVPDTIKSRCQLVRFKRAALTQIVTKLKKILKKEEATLADADLTLIAKAANGGFRDAETLLQQVIEGEMSVTSLTMVGTPEKTAAYVSFLISGDIKDALAYINDLYDAGMDMYVWNGELLNYLRNLTRVKAGLESEYDLEDKAEVTQAGQVTFSWLADALRAFIDAHKEIKGSFIPQLPLELATVKICKRADDADESSRSVKGDKPQPPAKKSEVALEHKGKQGNSVDAKVALESKASLETKGNGEAKSTVESKAPVKTQTHQMSVESVVEKWLQVIERVTKKNSSVGALVKNGKPIRVENNFIILEVAYSFHKERLESAKNRVIIEEELTTILASNMTIRCEVAQNQRNLTDFNVVPAEVVGSGGSILDIFDGGLPLMGAVAK